MLTGPGPRLMQTINDDVLRVIARTPGRAADRGGAD
jgi:hypothetical protein